MHCIELTVNATHTQALVTAPKVNLSSLIPAIFFAVNRITFRPQRIKRKTKIAFISILQRKSFEMRWNFLCFKFAITVQSLFCSAGSTVCHQMASFTGGSERFAEKLLQRDTHIFAISFFSFCWKSQFMEISGFRCYSSRISENYVCVEWVCVCAYVVVHLLYCMLSDLFHHAPHIL